MIVIIDGYNLLRTIYPKVKGFLDKQRKQLVEQLGYYKSKKGDDIKRIIIVFDGGEFGHAPREVRFGVDVMYSGQKRTADDWIIDYVESHKGQDFLLVTLDRKLIEECERFGVQSIDVVSFYDIMKNCLFEKAGSESAQNTGLQKYESGDIADDFPTMTDEEALTLLMNQSVFYKAPAKDDSYKDQDDRKGNSSKLSKKGKIIYSKLKKLR